MIITTNALTSLQSQQLQLLQQQQQLQIPFMLDNKFNLDKSMACFFLGYEDETLVSCLTIFSPDPDEVEIMACTMTEYRNQGWFTRLFNAALPIIKTTTAKRILFQLEAMDTVSNEVRQHLFPTSILSHSEYQMSCKQLQPPQDLTITMVQVDETNKELAIELSRMLFDDQEAISRSYIESILKADNNDSHLAILDGIPIGICNRAFNEHDVSLFGLGVKPELQGQGYGKQMLRYMTCQSLQQKPLVTLEVDSNNPRAFNLYQHNGFTIDFQVDYYEYIF